ncbi:hypothetical protein ACHAWF_006493, partial [Thalassiosira exigua]
ASTIRPGEQVVRSRLVRRGSHLGRERRIVCYRALREVSRRSPGASRGACASASGRVSKGEPSRRLPTDAS